MQSLGIPTTQTLRRNINHITQSKLRTSYATRHKQIQKRQKYATDIEIIQIAEEKGVSEEMLEKLRSVETKKHLEEVNALIDELKNTYENSTGLAEGINNIKSKYEEFKGILDRAHKRQQEGCVLPILVHLVGKPTPSLTVYAPSFDTRHPLDPRVQVTVKTIVKASDSQAELPEVTYSFTAKQHDHDIKQMELLPDKEVSIEHLYAHLRMLEYIVQSNYDNDQLFMSLGVTPSVIHLHEKHFEPHKESDWHVQYESQSRKVACLVKNCKDCVRDYIKSNRPAPKALNPASEKMTQ
jgi:hypothetical protein